MESLQEGGLLSLVGLGEHKETYGKQTQANIFSYMEHTLLPCLNCVLTLVLKVLG